MSRRLHVLAQGDTWIVVAKPPWMLTHRTAETPTAPAAVQSLRNMLGRPVFPIHRLDRPASGCLLFATEAEAAGPLSAAFARGHKRYLAFVRGDFRAEGDVVVDRPMKDDQGVLREARSVVRRLGGCPEPRCSLLLVRPESGRYHQVRRHVRDLNHPILGDGEHGDTRVNRWWREEKGLRRLGLHAFGLQVPDLGIDVVCPLFVDHHRLWSTLPWWPEALAAEPQLDLPPLRMSPRAEGPGDPPSTN